MRDSEKYPSHLYEPGWTFQRSVSSRSNRSSLTRGDERFAAQRMEYVCRRGRRHRICRRQDGRTDGARIHTHPDDGKIRRGPHLADAVVLYGVRMHGGRALLLIQMDDQTSHGSSSIRRGGVPFPVLTDSPRPGNHRTGFEHQSSGST